MTKLEKPIHRVTDKVMSHRNVVLTVAPGSESREVLIGVRLLGTRTQYVTTLSDVFRMAALNYATKISAAKRAARKEGVPWRIAKKAFQRNNTIPT